MSMVRPRQGLSIVALLIAAFQTACGDDADDSGGGGDAPGEPCAIDDPCPDDAWMCYAVGLLSSCRDGGLCAGVASGLTCATPCDTDADCAQTDPTFVCFVGCEEPLFNGNCIDPAARDELLTYPFCEEPGDSRGGVAGALR
jgi:hypothetical protein